MQNAPAQPLEPTADDARRSARAIRVGKRQLVRLRRRFGVVLLLLPALSSVALDAGRRAHKLLGFDAWHRATYAAAMLESTLVWGLLLYAAARRRGRGWLVSAVLFVLGITFTFGGQDYFHDLYSAYLNFDVSIFASNLMDSVFNQLAADWSHYMSSKLPALAFALLLLVGARRALRPVASRARVAVWAAPLVLVGSFFVPTQHRQQQAATPDALYLNAIGGMIQTQLGLTDQSFQLRPKVRNSLPVPPLVPRRHPPRNVLFFILESVRADSVCSSYEPDCRKTAYTNELLPDRFPLLQMRALDSTTAISLAVLWSGLAPTESREILHSWPLIFDYARAAGYDTAFWTSQNMLFGNARLWVEHLGVSKFCSATELDSSADLDMGAPERLLAERVNDELPELEEPFMAVVQLSNVHYPYYVEEDGPQPFQPAAMSKAPEDNLHFKNYYRNAVHQQDQHVAAIIRRLRETPAGQRTVIVYTSDHGEAFREHGQMGHTFSIFDEEVRVPAWIDAAPGTLAEQERRSLAAKRDAFTFHSDIAPTVLDLIGVWDDPAIANYKSRMIGTSLLRPALTERALPMTNCAGVWSCAFENWGYMRKNLKLESRSWDTGYKCYDVELDPFEQVDLGAAACGDLLDLARRTYRRVPGEDVAKPNPR